MKVIRAILLCVLLCLATACSPSLSSKDPIPEPVPDHGPPTENPLKRVMISYDIYTIDPTTGNEYSGGTGADRILQLICKLAGNARVKDPAGRYVQFPWANIVALPYDFVIYVAPGAFLGLSCTGTLLQVQPYWRFECVSIIGEGAVVDRNSDVVTPSRMVRPIRCYVSAAG